MKVFTYAERIRFIDYEYASFNYQAFDIANHFAEFAGKKLCFYIHFIL